MSETNEQDQGKGRLSLGRGRLELGKTVDAGSVRQSFPHGRSKVVQVEVVKKRVVGPGAAAKAAPTPAAPAQAEPAGPPRAPRPAAGQPRQLTSEERAARQRALEEEMREQRRREAEAQSISVLSAAEEARRRAEEERRRAEEEEAKRRAEEEARRRAEEEARRRAEEEARRRAEEAEVKRRADAAAERAEARGRAAEPAAAAPARPETLRLRGVEDEDEARPARRPGGAPAPKKPALAPAKKGLSERDRRGGRLNVAAVLSDEDERVRSLASFRRQRERERQQAERERLRAEGSRVVREVVIPEAITVQELAARMALRGAEVIKALMRMGVMATITQSLDADTAELVVTELGHKPKRVSESDVELGLEGAADTEADLRPRPPVVTVMGHVDHGKTSLLDALRQTDVAAHEAGGITQHIGAYQVELPSGQKITFIDTPGHEAFTAMRARGASVTDIVVLVVAADDGVMPQTVEAIRHAKAANAPIIVAINKIDKPDAKPDRVRNELLQHEIVVESMGGETIDVEVSALKKTNLDRLEEAILLQAEILDLKANPDRAAEGTVIESKLDRGRGPVATVLVQKGTLRQGDIVVAGAEWGRVRAMLDDKGRQLKEAPPSTPVEILGLSGVPAAGEPFVAVDGEARAREISEFRQRKIRERAAAGSAAARGTLDQMLARIQAGEQKEVAVVIKADVQGSAEAIQATVQKLGNEEVRVRVLHSAVGQITESDVQLAKASDAVIVAFNVRATSQARDLAAREGVDIRYYSIIYDVADDIENLVKGKVAPKEREKFLGYAEIRKVFEITKVGKVAGCMVTEGVVKRGAGVRLLRDNVVIHTGELSQLKRFKDDVREVAKGYECGMAFANYQDIREGDVIECFETETVPA
ncbi:translation initiation factor IF-2 [Elioraea sp.]|uniref:translation initiation factor IF-2 n=1 Tax=Elioraea sp. TaxID=2185103 RepID=UPI0021DCC3C4|nr:translation initiation factor IF-2 [Elioraea sp.]GIX09476.1 MAG: translation initiation factor IF-2 [Elioraea sp.]